MRISKFGTKLMLYLFAFLLLTAASGKAENNFNGLLVYPDRIKIKAFYNGSEINISADVYDCDDAVIVLKGADKEVTLNRKGRVAGIWLNVAQIMIDNLPDAYILAASKNLDSICPPEEQEKLGLGKKALQCLMHISSSMPLTGKEYEEFLKLKIHNGTYDMKEKVEIEPLSQSMRRVSTQFKIPSIMAPGTYKIQLLCFKQGKLENQRETELKIERIGMPRLMISLAYKYAALYGLLAILVAMAVGILMDVIFNSVPGSGH